MGNYKYYKIQLACVEAAQELTFTLSATNGNADLYVSRVTPFPSALAFTFKSELSASGTADVVSIPHPEAGMYYVGVFGTTTSTFKLRANTKMFTGKHPCRGFRLLDHDFEDENADGECRGYFPNPGRLVYLSAGYCLSIHRDILVPQGTTSADCPPVVT